MRADARSDNGIGREHLAPDMGLEPGDAALAFDLANANPDHGGEQVTLEDIMTSSGAVVVFECNHCPYVVGSIERIERMAEKARHLGMGFVGINANDAEKYPDDSFERMQDRASSMSYPYLHDATQEVASAYGAERTPEFYLIDGNGIIQYRGRLDNSPGNPTQATTSELSDALDAVSMGETPHVTRTQSIGCSVKWKI